MPRNKYIPGHQLKLLHSGEEYFLELEAVIASARNLLHLQVYIFDEDSTGKKIIAALTAAAMRGVKIYVMVDGVGSDLSRKCVNELKRCGILFRYFSPLPYQGLTQSGRRLHHKICVVDNAVALIGGINIADKYSGVNQPKPWFDYAIKIEGPICTSITGICESIWQRRFRRSKSKANATVTKGNSEVRISRNDWLRSKYEVSSSYKRMLRTAQKEIIIVASYFIPSRRLLKIIVNAARQGKKISIMLSRKSDVPFIKAATAYLYGRLLRNGVRIFEYTESILHAKVCVVDEEWCTIGSHNLNHLSEFLSVETNVDVMDKNFATALKGELEEVMKNHCVEITLEDYKRQGTAFEQLSRWISYKLVSWSMWLLEVVNRKESRT